MLHHVERRIVVIGAPLCDGERESGVEMAPRVLREAGLLESLESNAEVKDLGDITLATPARDVLSGKFRNVEHVVNGCRRVSQTLANALAMNYFPLVIGGDCSLFPGIVAGARAAYARFGVLYVDGHADFNTPATTISGYFSGMALAAAVGRTGGELGFDLPVAKEEDVCIIGIKPSNIDPPEWKNLEESHMSVVTADSLRQDGVAQSFKTVVEPLPKPFCLHLDVDVIDTTEMPAVAGIDFGVHSTGGLSYQETLALCRELAKLPLLGMDVTLYDPRSDKEKVYAKKIIDLLKAVLTN